MSAVAVAEDQRTRFAALLASAVPVTPPREWFEVEEPDEPTGWTVTADGQVFGHAAIWGTCHTGKTGRCVTPPRGSDYRFYTTGMVETADGDTIPTGRITLGTGHAALVASPQAVAEHYDNTGSVVADVTVRDGKHGIWVTGALRPGLSAERVRAVRGATLSGDWRRIGGRHELLGLLGVNVPGFPVPRPVAALRASADEEGEEETYAILGAGVYVAADEEVAEDMDEATFHRKLKALYAAADGMDGLLAAADPAAARGKRYKAAGKRKRGCEGMTAAGFRAGQKREPKGAKGGGRWTVETVNAEGKAGRTEWAEKEQAEFDYRGVRDRAGHVTEGKLVSPEGETVAKFDRGSRTTMDKTPAARTITDPTGTGKQVSRAEANKLLDERPDHVDYDNTEDRGSAMRRDPDAYEPTPRQREAQIENEVEEVRAALDKIISSYGIPENDASVEQFWAAANRYAYLRWPEQFED